MRCLGCEIRMARTRAETKRIVEREKREMHATREVAAFWSCFIAGQWEIWYDAPLRHEAQEGLANARSTVVASS